MSMKSRYGICLLLFFTLTGLLRSGESTGLNFFGSIQAILLQENGKADFSVQSMEVDSLQTIESSFSNSRASFAVQQMDLFFSKNISDDFSAFVDLEFLLNFSSKNDWGYINLEEAWVRYNPSEKFNVQAGLLFPKFNGMNEIKNRLFLFPYIVRPVIYEQALTNMNMNTDVVPERAFLQISGFFPLDGIKLDYAAYMGNLETSYISTNTKDDDGPKDNKNNNTPSDLLSGLDSKNINYKLFGCRLGVFNADETFRFGVSMTYDYDNRNDSTSDVFGVRQPPLGDVPRVRIGSDVFYCLWDFDIEAEYINVFYNYTPPDSLDLNFGGQEYFFATLTYNIFENLCFYGNYSFRSDKNYNYDLKTFGFGSCYRVNEDISLKIQYVNYNVKMEREVFRDWGPENRHVRAVEETKNVLNYLIVGISAKF